MPDINLLPEDLKKKQEKTLGNRGTFDLDEIEFTEGEKLKKIVDYQPKISRKSKLNKWFKPQVNNQAKGDKQYNTVKSSNLISKFKKTDNQKKEVLPKLEDKSDIPQQGKSTPLIKTPVISEIAKIKPLNVESDLSKTKPEIKQQKIKNKKVRKSLKSIVNKWSTKIQKKKKDKEEKEDDLDVNLLPFGSNVPTTRRMISIMIITFILSSSVIFVTYFAYHIYKQEMIRNHSNLKNELNIYIKDIEKYDTLIFEISSWQEKVKEVENLLNKHVYWTQFFEKLEENTLADVQFTGFAGSLGMPITLMATAPDYKTVSKQWIKLEDANDFVKNVEISGASMSSAEDRVNISFSLVLDFVEDIFYK
jgi:hypothetical protein